MHSTTKYNSVNKATNGVHSTLVYNKSVFCTLFLIAHQWCAVKLVCKCHLKVCYAHLISKSVEMVSQIQCHSEEVYIPTIWDFNRHSEPG